MGLSDAYKLVQRLGNCWGVVIGLTMCKTAHKHLHCVVDLCCGLGPMRLLISLIAGPSDTGGYLNPPSQPHSTFSLPTPLYMQLVIFANFKNLLKNKQIQLAVSYVFVH